MSERSFSFKRLVFLVVPLAALVYFGARFTEQYLPDKAQRDLADSMKSRLLYGDPIQSELESQFSDKDGDLLADSPTDDECLDPEKIVFSFVASEEEAD